MKAYFLITFLALFAGCSVLPYENDYSCRLEDNYGKCMSIQQAYDGSKNKVDGLNLVPGERIDMNRKTKRMEKGDKEEYVPVPTSKEMYIDELYREMALLIRNPETPIIRAPKEMRTLILSYSGEKNKRTLYMPRYIYTIVEDAEFVIKQYFKTPERDARIIEPKRAK